MCYGVPTSRWKFIVLSWANLTCKLRQAPAQGSATLVLVTPLFCLFWNIVYCTVIKQLWMNASKYLSCLSSHKQPWILLYSLLKWRMLQVFDCIIAESQKSEWPVSSVTTWQLCGRVKLVIKCLQILFFHPRHHCCKPNSQQHNLDLVQQITISCLCLNMSVEICVFLCHPPVSSFPVFAPVMRNSERANKIRTQAISQEKRMHKSEFLTASSIKT